MSTPSPAPAPAPVPTATGPIVLVVHVEVLPERRAEFLTVMEADAKGSVQNEPGCIRFDLLQDNTDANKFVF